jgi:hypothetical protein
MKTGSVSHKYGIFAVFVQFDVTGCVQMFVYMYVNQSVFVDSKALFVCVIPGQNVMSISC